MLIDEPIKEAIPFVLEKENSRLICIHIIILIAMTLNVVTETVKDGIPPVAAFDAPAHTGFLS